MSWLPRLLERRRLILATAFLLSLVGWVAWVTMPREEDPQFPARNGLVITRFPGADAETVERLVVEPLEEHLAEVEPVREIFSIARAGVAIVRVELHDHVYATADAWDEVEDALDEARADFPTGVSEPVLDDDLIAQDAVVLAVTGAGDPLVLAQAAERIKRELLGVPLVREVRLLADPGEQVTIEYDDAMARRLGLDPRLLGRNLAQRSQIVSGGLIHLGSKTATLRPQTEFRSLDELAATPVLLPSGSSLPLGTLARIRHGPAEPALERMRWQGEPAVGLGVVAKRSVDLVKFGGQVRARLAQLAPELEPLRVEEVFFQPTQVKNRLDELERSLLLGIVIVAAVLFLAMGWRLGMLVASVVPLVTFGSIAIYAAGGGILNQISIAALVIALGMLVDNAIVVAENVQWRLDRGEPMRAATVGSVRELAMPLGSATGTTLAAFVPMLLAQGGTADFTRAVPILILLTLTLSYVFAVLVTPVLAEFLLVRRLRPESDPELGWPRRLARLAVGRTGWVLAGAAVLVGLAAMGFGRVEQRFFPAADRNVVLVDLELPEGTHLERTDAAALEVERALRAHPQVVSVASFVGRNAPHFYYNLERRPDAPHRAQLVAHTRSLEAVGELIDWARNHVQSELPGVEVVARRLEQGPPLEAPVELRVFGHDFEAMEQAADAVMAELRRIPGTRDVRHDLGLGVPSVAFEIDDAQAGRHGLSRTDVALALYGRTLGTEIGQYRIGDDPVPILVRSSAGEESSLAELEGTDVATPGGEPVPLAQLARLEIEWRPAAIYHRDRQRVIAVQAQLADDTTAHEVLTQLEPRLAQLALPPGVRLEQGGEVRESGEANAAMMKTLPIGVLLLLGFLLLEFNSFRRVAIVLVTVPLAAIGVVPGLLLAGQPFGFMALLGVIALVGIVVNNAIMLIDVIETRRGEGFELEAALADAVARRIRPILLTTGTTVAGLLPLAFSSTTLWPPLAWSIISGLIASTLLTLLVVPALYQLLFSSRRGSGWRALLGRRRAAAAAMLGLLWLGARPAPAQEPVRLDLATVMQKAAERPQAQAALHRAAAAEQLAIAERRAASWPVLGVAGEVLRRDRATELETPIGAFNLSERSSEALALQLTQPLLDPARRFYAVPAARARAEAATSTAARVRQELEAEAAERFLEILAIDARREATAAFGDSLRGRLAETDERVRAGKALEADALKVRLDLESAELELLDLAERRRVAVAELARAVGVDGEVEPSFDGRHDRDTTPALAALMTTAERERPDLAALTARQRALALGARAVRAEAWPRLEARGRYLVSSGDPLRPDEVAEGSLAVVWNPFAAGTRGPRRAALEAEAEALETEAAELRRAIRVELQAGLATLATARAAIAVRERGVELASETLRVERERHAAGRSTTNDLLAAEAALHNQRTRQALARLEVLRAWIRLRLAAGAEVG